MTRTGLIDFNFKIIYPDTPQGNWSLFVLSLVQEQENCAKGFRLLMMRMVHCETTKDYEELWREYTKLLNAEPFVPERYQVVDNHEHTMTPELTILMAQKEVDVKAALVKVKDIEHGTSVKDRTEDEPMLGNNKGELHYGSCVTIAT